MDLYGTSGNAIAQGNMRTQQVRDLNDRIRQHNQDIADKIQGLKEQTQTADTVNQALETGKTLWEGSKMPGAIKTYQAWKAGKITGTSPEEAFNKFLSNSAKANNPIASAMNPNQVKTSIGNAVAEGSPSGLSVSEEASQVVEGANSKLTQGITNSVKDAVEGSAISKLGKGLGAIGAVAQGGVDLYQDFKGGSFHLAGDNWEQKAGNALNLAGSVADVAGTFYPPLAIIGGAFDLTSSALDMIGNKVSEDKKMSDLQQTQQTQTVSEVATPAQQTVATGRTQ